MINTMHEAERSVPQKTLLLVEDEALIGLEETRLLKQAGYRVLHVLSGEEAIEAVRNPENPVDLVLMDIDLGEGIDGTEAASAILELRDIPVVFLSSHTEKEYTDKTEKITSYGYIVKNSGETVLLASIKMAFKLFEANTALLESNRRLNAFLKISKAVTDAKELGPLLQSITDSAAEVTNLASDAIYLLQGPDTIRLAAATPSIPEDFPEKFRIADLSEHPHIRKSIDTGEILLLPDTRSADLTSAEQEVVQLRKLRTILYIPVSLDGKTMGVLILSSIGEVHQFKDEEIMLLVGFADQAARLIDKARAFEASKAKLAEMEARL
jgi:DNA-binding NarL/FixJ family response regulator